jgi:magnesium transporter
MTSSHVAPYGELTCFVAGPGDQPARACAFGEALSALEDPHKKTWINFLAPDEEHLGQVVAKLGFHELAVEDVFSRQSRAKVEEYSGHLFCVLPALNQNPGADTLDIVNLNAFLGRNYLITAHRAPLPGVQIVRGLMSRGEDGLSRGADFVLYLLLDAVVDEYLEASSKVSERLDEVEERIFARFDPQVSTAMFRLKHEAAWLRRRITPHRGIIDSLTNRTHELLSAETQVFLRDVRDHVHRIGDDLDTYDDLLQGALDVYLTLAAGRTNQIIKYLSILGAVLLPLTVLTGLYGTNFNALPGADHPYGFWILCGVLAVTAAVGIVIVRSRKWL